MQKTLTLVIHNAVKDNFTWAGRNINVEMQKPTPFTAQMQKTLPLVIHNAVKDNFTWADRSGNVENARNDTLYYTHAENPPPSHTQCCQRQLRCG